MTTARPAWSTHVVHTGFWLDAVAILENLRRRGAVLVFRRRVPADIRSQVGRSEIIRTLRTASPIQARGRSRHLWVETERLFRMLRENPSVTADHVAKLLSLLDADCRWADEVQLARQGAFFDHHGHPPPDADETVLATFARDYRMALARNEVSEVKDGVQRYAAKLGLKVFPDSLDEKILGRAILKGYAESCEAAVAQAAETRAANENALFPAFDRHAEPVPDATVLIDRATSKVLEEGEEKEPLAPRSRDGAPRGRSPSKNHVPAGGRETRQCVDGTGFEGSAFAGLPLPSLWESFTKDLVQKQKWSQGYARQSFGTMRLWQDIHDGKRFRTIGTAESEEFSRVLLALPGNYSKAKEWQGLKARQIVAAAKDKNLKPIAFTTANRHFSVMGAFFDWAVRNRALPKTENPFAGLWIEVSEDVDPMQGGSAKRQMWEDPQMRKLFQSPLFLGCHSEARRHKPGHVVIRDALYWVVLMTAYSGLRREEACQLKARHIYSQADPVTGSPMWFVDLKSPGLRLKGKESKRWVPLHKDLLALGFLEACVHGRQPEDRIFPELRSSAAYDTYGDKLGQRFTVYRKNIGLYEPLLDMHSFRHTVATLLMRAGVPQAHAEELTGHKSEARRTVFANYDKGSTVKILKEALDKLVLPVDIAALLKAAETRDAVSMTTSA